MGNSNTNKRVDRWKTQVHGLLDLMGLKFLTIKGCTLRKIGKVVDEGASKFTWHPNNPATICRQHLINDLMLFLSENATLMSKDKFGKGPNINVMKEIYYEIESNKGFTLALLYGLVPLDIVGGRQVVSNRHQFMVAAACLFSATGTASLATLVATGRGNTSTKLHVVKLKCTKLRKPAKTLSIFRIWTTTDPRKIIVGK